MTSIGFTGDIAFSKHFKGRCGEPGLLDPQIEQYLRACDHVVANVEGPLHRYDPTAFKTLVHASDPKTGAWLKTLGADIWNLCNNHVADCFADGLASTLTCAAENGAACMGAVPDTESVAQPYFLPEEGGIGFVSCCYDGRLTRLMKESVGILLWDDEEEVRRQIEAIKSQARWCIVVAHGGNEFTDLPEPWNRERYLRYLSYGADIVVAHHPHVVQNFETFGNKAIFYSLGNFVFDTDYQRDHAHTELGQLLRLHIDQDGFSWDGLSTRIDREHHRVVAAEPHPIFRDIPADSYERLWPVAAGSALAAQNKIELYEDRDKFSAFTPEEWLAFDEAHPTFSKLLAASRIDTMDALTEEERALVPYLREY